MIEISTTSAAGTYHRLDAEIIVAPYDGPIHTQTGNPLAGQRAWCGDPRDWHESLVDLSAYAGNAITLRFRFGTDNLVVREGWYVDDVRIEQCDALFFDDFETGDLSAWDLVFP